MEREWTRIRLETPGSGFADSFLLGNGVFGVSACLRPDTDSLLLSHTAFWSGAPPQTHGRPEAAKAFRKARALSLRGEHAAAYEALKDFIGEKENYGTNLPVGRLVVSQRLEEAEEYQRSLDLIGGEARCEFTHGKARQTRVLRCRANPPVLEMEFRDTDPMQITFSLEGPCVATRETAGNRMMFEARARETLHSDGTCGVFLSGGFALTADGAVEAGPDHLFAQGNIIRLFLTMETDFTLSAEEPPPSREALQSRVAAALEDCLRESGSALREKAEEPLPVLLELDGEPEINRQVLFGHYLLRASLSEESPLPPNLQGVWNDEEACRLGWTNDYHLDVNTQLNLGCAEALGEGDRLAPLFRFMLRRLIPEGEKTARGYYGLPGAVAELSSNCFGYAAPYWGRPLAPCPACGFWLCELVIRHALARPEDQRFLRETAWPILRPYVEFALAYVTEDAEGHLIGGPAVSPENGFLAEGRTVYASMGTAFENEQLRILLDGYAEVCRLLGVSDTLRAAETSRRLPPLSPDGRGEIPEYAHDLPSAVPHHRHMSHLSGLYPGRSIRPDRPELAAAAEKTIRSRILPEEAYESTPWARAMLALYEARLCHGDQALGHLEKMISCHGSPSLLMMHPAIPGTLNPRPVWELDGNTGFTEAVLEMLVQASGRCLALLPALPSRWKKGRIRNIQAGPWRIPELSWDLPGRLSLRLRGRPGETLEIQWNQDLRLCQIPQSGELTETW